MQSTTKKSQKSYYKPSKPSRRTSPLLALQERRRAIGIKPEKKKKKKSSNPLTAFNHFSPAIALAILPVLLAPPQKEEARIYTQSSSTNHLYTYFFIFLILANHVILSQAAITGSRSQYASALLEKNLTAKDELSKMIGTHDGHLLVYYELLNASQTQRIRALKDMIDILPPDYINIFFPGKNSTKKQKNPATHNKWSLISTKEELKNALQSEQDLKDFENILLQAKSKIGKTIEEEILQFFERYPHLTEVSYMGWAMRYSTEHVARFLIDYRDFAHHIRSDGSTLLHDLAADENEIFATKTAKQLIENGIDINHQDETGAVPIHFAIALGRAEMTRLLLNANADIHIKTHLSFNAIFHQHSTVLKHIQHEAPVTPLELAQLVTNTEVINWHKNHETNAQANNNNTSPYFLWGYPISAVILALTAFLYRMTQKKNNEKQEKQNKSQQEILTFLRKCTENIGKEIWQISDFSQFTLSLPATIQYDASFLLESSDLTSIPFRTIEFASETLLKLLSSQLQALFPQATVASTHNALTLKLLNPDFSVAKDLKEVGEFKRKLKQALANTNEMRLIKEKIAAANKIKQAYEQALNALKSLEGKTDSLKKDWENIDTDVFENLKLFSKRVIEIFKKEPQMVSKKLATMSEKIGAAANSQTRIDSMQTLLEKSREKLETIGKQLDKASESEIESIKVNIIQKITPIYNDLSNNITCLNEGNLRLLLAFLTTRTPQESDTEPSPTSKPRKKEEPQPQTQAKEKPRFFPAKKVIKPESETKKLPFPEVKPAKEEVKSEKVEFVIHQPLPQDYHPFSPSAKKPEQKFFKPAQQPSKLPAETLRHLATQYILRIDALLNQLPDFNLHDEDERKIVQYAMLYYLIRVIQALWLEGMQESFQNNNNVTIHVKKMRHMIVHLFNQIEINGVIETATVIKNLFLNYLHRMQQKNTKEKLTRSEYLELAKQIKTMDLYQELLPQWQTRKSDEHNLNEIISSIKEACTFIKHLVKIIDSKEKLEREGADRLAAIKMLYFVIGEYGSLLRDNADKPEFKEWFEKLSQTPFLNKCIDIRNRIGHAFHENQEDVDAGKLLNISKGLGDASLLQKFLDLLEKQHIHTKNILRSSL